MAGESLINTKRRYLVSTIRFPRETSQIQKGYGIGLSYVKYIIQAHGGKIRLRSRENEGSTFTFYISK